MCSLVAYGQLPDGMYFEKINGTAWQSIEIDTSVILNSKNIGLVFVQVNIDSIKSNTTLWTFNEKLVIISYNCITKEKQVVFECRYEHDKVNKILKLFFDNEIIEFNYLTISTGSYVGLSRKKKK